MARNSPDDEYQLPAGVEPIYESYSRMEKDLTKLANRTSQLILPRNPHFSRRDVVAAFQTAFEMIGGVPRLALWAHDNPGEFYKLYGKLLPSATAMEILPAGRAPGQAPLRSYTTEELEHMLADAFEGRSPLEGLVAEQQAQFSGAGPLSAEVIPFTPPQPSTVTSPEDDYES